MTAFAVARSTRPDTRSAVREVLDGLGGEPRFVLCYADLRYDLAEVARVLKERFPAAPLAGCTTSGEISSAGVQEGGIVCFAGMADDLHAAAASAPGVLRDPEAAARALAGRLKEANVGGAHRVLVAHAPGFTVQDAGWEQRAFPVLERELGSDVLIVGGSAGDGLKFLGSKVHEGGRAMDDALVAMLIGSDRPVVASLQHGYRSTGKTARVTRARDTMLYELDGVRATRRYAELIGIPEKELAKGAGMVKLGGLLPKRFTALSQTFGMTPKKMLETLPFYQHTVRHPLGRVAREGAFQVIFPRLAKDDGSLDLFVGVPEGAELHLMERDEDIFVRAPENALRDCREQLGGAPAATLLVECAGRKMILGDRLGQSFEHLKPLLGGPLAGFYSHGEQGRFGAPPVTCNNYSVVALCFGE